jgi:hypothetical protein
MGTIVDRTVYMKVPENWWVGCKGFKLHDGEIDSFNIQSQKWNLLLDARDEPFPFLIAYEAVYEYADEDSSTYHEYRLTYEAVRDGDEELETEIDTYTKTTWQEWNQVSTEDGDGDGDGDGDDNGNGNGCPIDPVEFTVDEDFSVKITDEEVELLRDENSEIKYEKVFQWCLPRFGDDDDESLSEF